MKMRFCTNSTYNALRNSKLTSVTGTWSQENVKFCGITIACSQPDMISEDYGAPDMCWAIWPFYKLNVGVKTA